MLNLIEVNNTWYIPPKRDKQEIGKLDVSALLDSCFTPTLTSLLPGPDNQPLCSTTAHPTHGPYPEPEQRKQRMTEGCWWSYHPSWRTCQHRTVTALSISSSDGLLHPRLVKATYSSEVLLSCCGQVVQRSLQPVDLTEWLWNILIYMWKDFRI